MNDSPEARLLVDLCRGDGEDSANGSGPMDVGRFLQLTRIHAVRPTVLRALERREVRLDAGALEQLRSEVRVASLRGLAATAQLLQIVELLDHSDVASLPFKGPLLAEQAYGDVAMREFVDLDVLVRPSDVRRAFGALNEVGYVAEPKYEAAALSIRMRYGHEQTFTGEGILPLELQWGLGPSYLFPHVSIEGLLARAELRCLAGVAIRGLRAEDLVVALCIHASKHRWERLAWIVDLDRLARTEAGIDWARVREVARRMRVHTMVNLGPAVVREVLGSRWTEEALAIPEAPDLSALARRCTADMFMPGEAAEHAPESAFDRTLLAMRDRHRDAVRQVAAQLLTPTEDDVAAAWRRDLPTGVYVPVRLFRLAMGAIGRAVGRIIPTSSRPSAPLPG